MAVTRRLKIVLIGSGNVATHLGKAIHRYRDYPIVQIYSRDLSHAKSLGTKLSCSWTNNFSEINTQAHIYLLAIHDDAIDQVATQLASILPPSALVAHTAGSVSAEVLSPYFKNYGVLYPLQTFTKAKKMSYVNIPILITASSKQNSALLQTLAGSITTQVISVSDEARGYIHLAAVMVNNFPNYLYLVAHKLLQSQGIDFKILLPLIEETTSKIKSLTPEAAQTGPARRKDTRVISKHLDILKNAPPDWGKVYKILTEAIQNEFE